MMADRDPSLCRHSTVLTLATLGLLGYGVYSTVWPLVDIVSGARLELWANLATVAFGLLLALSAAFVRVQLPGGLALALGATLGLQALAVHSAAHFGQGLAPQIVRGCLAALLLAGARLGGQQQGE